MGFSFGPVHVTPTKAVRDYAYYLDMRTFEVEDVLFQIPRHILDHSCSSLVLVKSLGGFSSDIKLGESEATQVTKLEKIEVKDFRAFLKCIFPLSPTPEALSITEWISVLKLASEWKALKLRAHAISELDKLSNDFSLRIYLGREYGIVDWVTSGYVDFLQYGGPITLEMLDKVGLSALTKLCCLRETPYERRVEELRRQKHALNMKFTCAAMAALGQDQPPPANEEVKGLAKQLLSAFNAADNPRILSLSQEIVERQKGLSAEEAIILGSTHTMKLWHARLEFRKLLVNNGNPLLVSAAPWRIMVVKLFAYDLQFISSKGEDLVWPPKGQSKDISNQRADHSGTPPSFPFSFPHVSTIPRAGVNPSSLFGAPKPTSTVVPRPIRGKPKRFPSLEARAQAYGRTLDPHQRS